MQQNLFHYPSLDVRAGSVFDLVFDDTKPTAEDNRLEQTHSSYFRIKGIRLGMIVFGWTTSRNNDGIVQTRERSLAALKSSFAQGRF